jgi:hypothetical protein
MCRLGAFSGRRVEVGPLDRLLCRLERRLKGLAR